MKKILISVVFVVLILTLGGIHLFGQSLNSAEEKLVGYWEGCESTWTGNWCSAEQVSIYLGSDKNFSVTGKHETLKPYLGSGKWSASFYYITLKYDNGDSYFLPYSWDGDDCIRVCCINISKIRSIRCISSRSIPPKQPCITTSDIYKSEFS